MFRLVGIWGDLKSWSSRARGDLWGFVGICRPRLVAPVGICRELWGFVGTCSPRLIAQVGTWAASWGIVGLYGFILDAPVRS